MCINVKARNVFSFQRVVLSSDTDEYKKIVERFDQTMSEFNVTNVEKVLNADLWEDFQRYVFMVYKAQAVFRMCLRFIKTGKTE